MVCTNTFQADSFKYSDEKLEEIISAAIQNAKLAAEQSTGVQEKFIALDVGPLGKLLKPFGEIEFESAVESFAKKIKLGAKHGANLIYIATMNDCLETKAALLAAKVNCDLPVIVSNTFDQNNKLMTGADAKAMIALLEGMGADAIGINCSFGPKQLTKIVDEYIQYASVPIILKPNAGLPEEKNGKTVVNVDEDEFCDCIEQFAKKGVRILGGCCGTKPNYIQQIVNRTKNLKPAPITKKNKSFVSSYTHAVDFSKSPVIIGERINPTGKPKLKDALINQDTAYVLKEAI
ncbi:MAG: homocysteine S-methyltransferase family protein, partial [Clostridia bacterium]|nr:homocysteine S-methyltransferase family protein [Clostridia bacterium]